MRQCYARSSGERDLEASISVDYITTQADREDTTEHIMWKKSGHRPCVIRFLHIQLMLSYFFSAEMPLSKLRISDSLSPVTVNTY